MSTFLDELMNDENETDDEPGFNVNELPKKLRNELRRLAKENKNLRDQVSTFEGERTKNTISDIVQAAGFDPKLANFISRDLSGNVTAESVTNWLTENGSLFAGAQVNNAAGTTDGGNATSQAQGRMAAAENGAQSAGPAGDIASQLADPTLTRAKLDELLRQF